MANHVDDALDVDVDNPIELGGWNVPERCVAVDHGRVIDQQIGRPEPRHYVLAQAFTA